MIIKFVALFLCCWSLLACQLSPAPNADDEDEDLALTSLSNAFASEVLAVKLNDYQHFLRKANNEQLQWHYLDLQSQENSQWQQIQLVLFYAYGQSPVWNPHRADNILKRLFKDAPELSQQGLLLSTQDQLQQLLTQIYKNEALKNKYSKIQQQQRQQTDQLIELKQQIEKLTQLEQELHER